MSPHDYSRNQGYQKQLVKRYCFDLRLAQAAREEGFVTFP